MKRTILLILFVFFVFVSASAVLAKPSRVVIAADSIRIDENESGIFTLSLEENPSALIGYKNPIICNGSVRYINGNIPFCDYPFAFLDKSGKIMISDVDPTDLDEKNLDILGQMVRRYTGLKLLDTPESVFYCVYLDDASPFCNLYPTDPATKIGDQFWACIGPVSYALSGGGPDLVIECDQSGRGAETRLGKLIVSGFSPEGNALLRFTVWGTTIHPTTAPLVNGRPWGVVYSGGYKPTYILKRILPQKKKSKNSKSKKK